MCAAHSKVCGWCVVSGAPKRMRIMVNPIVLGKAVRMRASNAGCEWSAYEISMVSQDSETLYIQRVC